ncbi:MAG: hypothetical protein KDE46_01215 [Caldilineaceae bacterium]|nr:hypothetical protein [Caldilineaceae bacterium]
MQNFEGITNTPNNFERLFAIHESIGFDGNLLRLVEATNNIAPTGKKFEITDTGRSILFNSPNRAKEFIASDDFITLKSELDSLVERFRNEILLAALIENVNIRGRIIEYLIAGEDKILRQEIIQALQKNEKGLPEFRTANELGDYHRVFERFITETDVKTKIMILSSNPKAYNIDKILGFLSEEHTVFLFYFVGVDPTRIANTVLISMFQEDLLGGTITLKHWAGRNSRGVTQIEGKTVESLIQNPRSNINLENADTFLNKLVEL